MRAGGRVKRVIQYATVVMIPPGYVSTPGVVGEAYTGVSVGSLITGPTGR